VAIDERLSMRGGKIRHKKMEIEEQWVQKFSNRCPYCDRPISYEQFDLKSGENEIQCPSCKKIYIKVVTDVKEQG
jgi:uncharacterized Zn-finger protein